MGSKNASIAHCVQSNLKLASGLAPMHRLLEAGANVTIGTDGASSNNDQDMLSEISTASLLQKAISNDPTAFNAAQALTCATENAAKALQLPNVGVLKPGNSADFMVVSYDGANMRPVYDHLSHLIYCASKKDITHLYVDGVALMENRALTTIDEEEVAAVARKWQGRIGG
jgi:5-methylthioadenosine/S-adenosylhomocysteine deaminase